MGVVGPEGQAVAQQVAGDVQAAVGAVFARVLAERVGPGERAADGAGLRVVGARGGREGERRKGAGDGARTEDPEHRAVR